MSHLFLTGFMGAGKSTVGPLVAERLGRAFIDLDMEIERQTGSSVSALFASGGEDAFRELEHAALESLRGCPDAVVATGGGVILRDDNRCLLRELGTVVYLSVTPEVAIARIGDATSRPLLAGRGVAAAREIIGARHSLYQVTADHVVDATSGAPGAVADEVIQAFDTGVPRTIRVSAGAAGGYDVLVGRGLLERCGDTLARLGRAGAVALVSDETVWRLYGAAASASLARAGFEVRRHVVPAGESSKAWDVAGALLEALAADGLDRASTVVGLGGGVVGDLAGFCAATFMRGIPVVHVPTTMLAQVDSSIGGKTAVDLAAGKNLAGAFWQPLAVIADIDCLQSLPAPEVTNGLVEAAKAALLEGPEALRAFEATAPAARLGDAAARERIVADAAAFKAKVVSEDERESSLRECLNLGHTLGHALETALGYGVLPHGLAVAEGMRFAASLAAEVAGAAPDTAKDTARVLAAVGAGAETCHEALGPHRGGLTAESLVSIMRRDKKSRGGAVRFVLLTAPGVWNAVPVEDEVLLGAVSRWLAGLTTEV